MADPMDDPDKWGYEDCRPLRKVEGMPVPDYIQKAIDDRNAALEARQTPPQTPGAGRRGNNRLILNTEQLSFSLRIGDTL